MIIECPQCNKKFQIDENLISSEGRLLQCGSCNHKWFFQLNQVDKKIEKKKEKELNINKDLDTNIEISKKEKKDKINKNIEKISNNALNNKKSFNYFNILIVIIISLIAVIVIIDTFKYYLISLFPNIEFFLNNLYETIKDIKLFIIDLIK
tara:strand:+ start:501 stop:953 length:453 start_codon:yes stop_codon:yes gene_type:complete